MTSRLPPGRTVLFGVSTGIVTRSFFEGQFAALRAAGWQVVYATTDERGARRLAEAEGAVFAPIPIRRDPTPWQDAAALLAVMRLLRAHHPDVCVWAHPRWGCSEAWPAASAACGASMSSTACATRPPGLASAGTPARRGGSLPAADVVVPVGHDVAETLVADRVTSAARIEILGRGSANGVQVPPPQPRAPLDVPVPPDDVVVGFVGRLTRDKACSSCSRPGLSSSRTSPGALSCWPVHRSPMPCGEPSPRPCRPVLGHIWSGTSTISPRSTPASTCSSCPATARACRPWSWRPRPTAYRASPPAPPAQPSRWSPASPVLSCRSAPLRTCGAPCAAW